MIAANAGRMRLLVSAASMGLEIFRGITTSIALKETDIRRAKSLCQVRLFCARRNRPLAFQRMGKYPLAGDSRSEGQIEMVDKPPESELAAQQGQDKRRM